ncbi:MAG: DUF655 domain-containing protein [Candidatus Diapherotrites archaeon]|jgi:putative nucleotide binding protein|uniref:DUF655 domain-containing protein n=1 Tax=Candidatus Iainarchaeum sp. TaxID=3101447 RepID=A0A7K4BYF1_9ARCH|nr:DUF655 domain-containing protein [Candidatus Diapherotrites archaeon]
MAAEEYAYVLDYLPTGKSSAATSEPLAQVIGQDHFTLLEVTPKPGITLTIGEKIYVGKETREKVELIKGRIAHKDLTSVALSDLEEIIEKIIDQNSEKYIGFFNTSKSISLIRHQLELLPGLGKKHMLLALDEREKKPFENFEDVTKRVPGIKEPKKSIIKRIVEELEGPLDKHYIFVRAPSEPKQFHTGGYNRGFTRPNYPPRKY